MTDGDAKKYEKYLLQLPRSVKNKATGKWETVYDAYLPVQYRLVWFRDRCPHGSLTTAVVTLDHDKGLAIFQATVTDGEGGVAMGTGAETRAALEKRSAALADNFVEKAETRAIGRALAALGIGTQFVGSDLSEDDQLADAPVKDLDHRLDDIPAPEVAHPTADQLAALIELAHSAGHDLDHFGSDMRKLLEIPPEMLMSKKFLREWMSLEQFAVAETYYEKLIAQRVTTPQSTGEEVPTDAARGKRATTTEEPRVHAASKPRA